MFCLYSTNIVPCAAGGRGGEKSGRKKLGPFPAVFYPTFFVCSLRSRSMKYIGRVSHARERENTRGFTLACLPPSHSTHFGERYIFFTRIPCRLGSFWMNNLDAEPKFRSFYWQPVGFSHFRQNTAISGPIKFLTGLLKKALTMRNHRYQGFSASELAEGLAQIAVNDNNKKTVWCVLNSM